MRSGLLRHVVHIDAAVTEVSEAGAVSTAWVPFLDGPNGEGMAAHVMPAGDQTGRETYTSAQVMATVDTKIRIRYRPGITAKMRVRQEIGPGSPTQVDLFDIQAVVEADSRKRELWLWCRRRDAEGFR